MSSIDDPSVKAIDAKSQSNTNNDTDRKTNDWGGFFKSVFQNVIHIFLLVLLICKVLLPVTGFQCSNTTESILTILSTLVAASAFTKAFQ